MSLHPSSRYKILLKVSGSIAAYKAAALCSQLLQKGFEVRVLCSTNALQFIGAATFEGLTGHPVGSDTFKNGRSMDHIHLIRWADLVLLYPATANTINKMASGLGDDILTTSFLAHDFTKPYLIAPAMNSKMYTHPTTQSSLKKLQEMGLHLLPTEEGHLACGETGSGRVMSPEKTLKLIRQIFYPTQSPQKILITAGGTRENIDGVRFISNMSSGRTGAQIADELIKQGHHVTFVHAQDSQIPKHPHQGQIFTSTQDLEKQLKDLLGHQYFDQAIHLAAVSDYSVAEIKTDHGTIDKNSEQKISSRSESLTLELKKNPKLVDFLKSWSKNSKIKIVAFKLTKTNDVDERQKKVQDLFSHSHCDLVVHNDLLEIEKDQHQFTVYNPQMKKIYAGPSLPKMVQCLFDKGRNGTEILDKLNSNKFLSNKVTS